MVLTPETLGSLLRHLQSFESLHESEGIDTLPGPGGDLYCLADLLRLYEMRSILGHPQDLAIEGLYLDLTDADAAKKMGLPSPRMVADYVRTGLQHLCLVFNYGLWKEGWDDSSRWLHSDT